MSKIQSRRNADYRRLDAVIAYGTGTCCQRGRLLRYFGETLPEDYACKNCSACSGGTAQVSRAAAEDEAVRVLRRNQTELEALGALTVRLFSQFLRGSKAKRMPKAWRKLRGFGALSHFLRDEVDPIAAKALQRVDVREPEAVTSSNSARGPAREAKRKVSRPPISLASAAGRSGTEVFWRTRDREFTVGELRSRKVPRSAGLAVLAIVAEAKGKLTPSGIANVLGGSRSCDVVKANPGHVELLHFGALKGKGYAEIIPDVLAMHAKGYLRRAAPKGKKLALSAKGMEILARAGRTAR